MAKAEKKPVGKKGKKRPNGLRERKREEFEREGAGSPARSWMIAAAIGFSLMAIVGFAMVRAGSQSEPERAAVTGSQDYTASGNVEMTDVKAKVAGGKVVFPLPVLKEKKLLYFKYQKDGVDVPLMAMLTPSGRVFTGSSMCEPCRSDRFHTEPDGTLTCNACGTKWDLETLKGISGGCPNYPPQEMKNEVRGGQIVLKEGDVRGWQPRPV